jgi:hypothetical protein
MSWPELLNRLAATNAARHRWLTASTRPLTVRCSSRRHSLGPDRLLEDLVLASRLAEPDPGILTAQILEYLRVRRLLPPPAEDAGRFRGDTG